MKVNYMSLRFIVPMTIVVPGLQAGPHDKCYRMYVSPHTETGQRGAFQSVLDPYHTSHWFTLLNTSYFPIGEATLALVSRPSP